MGSYTISHDAILSRISTASHLIHDSRHYLEEHDYVVGPKADGERMLLFWGKKSKRLYLISPTQLRSVEKNSHGYIVSLLNTFEYL
jgi:hypothetical protein